MQKKNIAKSTSIKIWNIYDTNLGHHDPQIQKKQWGKQGTGVGSITGYQNTTTELSPR